MSLMNGLSQMGAGLASFAGTAGLEQQKADLAQAGVILADKLATVRESAGRQEAGQIAATAAQAEHEFQGGQNEAQRANLRAIAGTQAGATLGAATISAEASRANTIATVNAMPPEVKEAIFLAGATPEQKAAYSEAALAKAGVPAWLMGAGTPTPAPATGGTTPPAGTTPAPTDNSVAPATAPAKPDQSGFNTHALDGIPAEGAAVVKAMVDGRLQPPSSMALAKPYWQGLLSIASQYDPNFDQTTWASRVATRKDFTSGQSAKAITALNTALGHAGRTYDTLSALNNSSLGWLVNEPINAVESTFGDARLGKATMDVSALAAEARKVFAASGGGNLTELEDWKKNFPLHGSPEQQKGALAEFASLLESRLSALADTYNRGMRRTEDPITLLEPHAQQVFGQLTGRTPDSQTGYQMGAAPPAPAAPAQPKAAAATSAPAVAPADPTARKVGASYLLPNGQTGVWAGNGWQVSQ